MFGALVGGGACLSRGLSLLVLPSQGPCQGLENPFSPLKHQHLEGPADPGLPLKGLCGAGGAEDAALPSPPPGTASWEKA